jgi:hypothetical protein
MDQWFSTWGTHPVHRGYASSSQGVHKIIKTTQKKTLWVEFLIRGYARGVQFLLLGTQRGTILNLGIGEYQKVENPCYG